MPRDVRTPYDVREVIARIVDGSELQEFKASVAHHVGSVVHWGILVAILEANCQWRAFPKGAEGRPLHRACSPAAHTAAFPAEYLRFHGRRKWQKRGDCQERRKARDGGGDGIGTEDNGADRRQLRCGNYGTCGRAYQPRFLFINNARISVMAGEAALFWRPQIATCRELERLSRKHSKAPIRQKYEDEGNPYYANQ